MEDKKIEYSKESNLRVRKTQNALYDAICTLLEHRNFNSITVHDLCLEALTSRATFYSHFRDKYDLLNQLLSEIRENIIKDVNKYDELEREINQFIASRKKSIANVLVDANSETLALIRGFMSSIVELTIKRQISEANPQRIIFFNFVIGGLVNLLTWVVENDYPPEITLINTYLYEMLGAMMRWDAQQAEENTELPPSP